MLAVNSVSDFSLTLHQFSGMKTVICAHVNTFVVCADSPAVWHCLVNDCVCMGMMPSVSDDFHQKGTNSWKQYPPRMKKTVSGDNSVSNMLRWCFELTLLLLLPASGHSQPIDYFATIWRVFQNKQTTTKNKEVCVWLLLQLSWLKSVQCHLAEGALQ